jgi:hypothetical protein
MKKEIDNYITNLRSLVEFPLRRTLVHSTILFNNISQFICHPERSEGHH